MQSLDDQILELLTDDTQIARRLPMLWPVAGAWPEQILAMKKNTKAGALHKWLEYGRSIPEVARQSGKGYF